jgi:hypothetical protein
MAHSFPIVKDPSIFSTILSQLETFIYVAPPKGTPALKIAESVLEGAKQIGVKSFLTPEDFLKGNPKLNLGFAAQLFHARYCDSLSL